MPRASDRGGFRATAPWREDLTVFLWHLSAVVVLVGGLNLVHWLPPSSVGSGTWWAWRVPWLAALAVILAGLVAIFGPVEARTARSAVGRRPARLLGRLTLTLRTVLTAVGYGAVVAGLLINSNARMSAPEPLGLPPGALVAYLVGEGSCGCSERHPGTVPAVVTVSGARLPAAGSTGETIELGASARR